MENAKQDKLQVLFNSDIQRLVQILEQELEDDKFKINDSDDSKSSVCSEIEEEDDEYQVEEEEEEEHMQVKKYDQNMTYNLMEDYNEKSKF